MDKDRHSIERLSVRVKIVSNIIPFSLHPAIAEQC